MSNSAKDSGGSADGQKFEYLEWTGERLVTSISGQIASEHLHRYAIACMLADGKDVLDIASGEGYGSALLAQRANSVVGVEIDQTSVDHATSKYAYGKLRFLQGECISIPLPDSSVDLVVSFETIEHINSQEKFLGEVLRVLRPNGVLIISTPERINYDAGLDSKNPFHVKELSRTEFKNLVTDCFKYTSLLAQRYASASVILGEDENRNATCGIFSGDYTRIEFSKKLIAPTYLLAICSNESLPVLHTGIFDLDKFSGIDPVAENIRLGNEITDLKNKISHLTMVVESAELWQRSWFKRAFHRWHPSKPHGIK